MARTTAEIQSTMDDEQATQPALSSLNSTSQVAIYTWIKNLFANIMSYFEQLMDSKKDEIEAIFTQGAVSSVGWVQQKCFEFQYDSITPQIVQLVNFVPTYNPVDPSKRIITRATVLSITGNALVCVTKSEPPVKLAAGELTAINNYFSNEGDGTNKSYGIGFVGQVITVVSLDPDFLFFDATIYYSGQYAATFQADFIQTMTNYLSNKNNVMSNDGSLYLINFLDKCKSVQGFVDINVVNLAARAAATAFNSKTYLINSSAISATLYYTAAGYMIPETTASNTWADKLTFTAV